MKVQETDGAHHILAHADDSLLDENVNTVTTDTKALLHATNEADLEVNAENLSTRTCLDVTLQTKILQK
jgi:hypothetical protein